MIVHLKTQIDSTARLRTLLRATELCGFVLTKEAKKLVFKCLCQIIALGFREMSIRNNDFPARELSVIDYFIKKFLILRNVLAEEFCELLTHFLRGPELILVDSVFA